MKITNYLTIITTIFLLFGIGCQNAANNNAVNQTVVNSANTANKNNANQTVTNQPEANKSETSKSATDSLATPTEAYKSAYNARQKKDIEGLKKVLSKEALEFFTQMSKMDGKSLDDALKELTETPQASTLESRNEKITGDRATLEFLDEKGKWSPMDFIKEGNDWKLTIPKSDPMVKEDKKKEEK